MAEAANFYTSIKLNAVGDLKITLTLVMDMQSWAFAQLVFCLPSAGIKVVRHHALLG